MRKSPAIKQAQKNNFGFHSSQSEQTTLGYIEVDSKNRPTLRIQAVLLKYTHYT